MDPLNVPYFHFRWILKLLTSHKCKPHPLSNKLAIVTTLGQWSPLQSEIIASLPEMEALHGQKTISKPICGREMAHPVLTKGFLQLRPEAAMLPGPSVETHPPRRLPLFCPFCSPKDFARSDITS